MRVPKAKPRAFEKMRESAQRVMGIVMLKRKTASVPASGWLGKRKRSAASDREMAAVRIMPKRSERRPPKAFPATRAMRRKSAQCHCVFQSKERVSPT